MSDTTNMCVCCKKIHYEGQNKEMQLRLSVQKAKLLATHVGCWLK